MLPGPGRRRSRRCSPRCVTSARSALRWLYDERLGAGHRAARPPSRPADPSRPVAPGAPGAPVAELRKASHALDGVFVNELFKAMRATVPQGGFLSEDPGHDLFTAMLDERLAQTYAERAEGGLGEALYRQLSRRLTDAGSDQGAS